MAALQKGGGGEFFMAEIPTASAARTIRRIRTLLDGIWEDPDVIPISSAHSRGEI